MALTILTNKESCPAATAMVLLSYSPTEHNTILQPLQIGHGHGPIQFFAKHLPDTLIYIEMKHLATHLLFWPNVHCLEICPSPQLSWPRPLDF